VEFSIVLIGTVWDVFGSSMFLYCSSMRALPGSHLNQPKPRDQR
jgi:hypothetical protein